MHVAGGVREIRDIRSWVSRALDGQPAETRDAGALLADECLANAVRYGGGHYEVTVVRRAALLRVEVLDQSPGAPVLLPTAPTSEQGRGLGILNHLASRWGSDPVDPEHKVVWFELDLECA